MKLEFSNAWRLVFAALLFLSVRVSAQPSKPSGGPPMDSSGGAASQAWEKLKKSIESDAARQQTSAKKPNSSTLATKYKGRAVLFREFHERYPEHPAAKEAQRLEAVALNRSAFNGDTSQDARRRQLVAQLRTDPALTAAKRFEAVAWSEQVDIARQKPTNHNAFLAAQEVATRRLIAEFPEVPTGYQSLLGIARESAPGRGLIIVHDLIAAPETPPEIRRDADLLRQRYSLLDQRLDSVLAERALDIKAEARGKTVVLYTWSTAMPRQLEIAKKLAKQAPVAVFIGLCADSDSEAAKKLAATAVPPGVLHYDTGPEGKAIRNKLFMSEGMAFYIADRSGVIRDVHGHQDFVRKVTQLDR